MKTEYKEIIYILYKFYLLEYNMKQTKNYGSVTIKAYFGITSMINMQRRFKLFLFMAVELITTKEQIILLY